MILGHLIVQLRLVFCILGTDTFLAYVQRFNVRLALEWLEWYVWQPPSDLTYSYQ